MQAFAENPGVYFGLASAVLVVGFAVAVAARGGFRGKYLAFLLAEAGFGLAAAASNLFEILEFGRSEWANANPTAFVFTKLLGIVSTGTAVVGLFLLAKWFPDPAKTQVSPRPMWALGLALALGAATGVLGAFTEPWDEVESLAVLISNELEFIGWALLVSGQLGVVAVMGLIHGRAPPEAGQARTEAALIGAALAIYPASRLMILAYNRLDDLLGPSLYRLLAAFALIGLAMGAWVWATRGHGPRTARNMVLWIGALGLAGAAWYPVTGADFSLSGPARFLTVFLLAYAILRHDFLGLDVRVRWGISKSTIAAVFVSVVFLASEGAQIVFGDGNQWIGLAAGGALVFALAPLSRFADRVAERAIPARDLPTLASGGKKARSLYLDLANRLAADGEISTEDHRTLAHVAEEFGLGAGEAHDLLDQVRRTRSA